MTHDDKDHAQRAPDDESNTRDKSIPTDREAKPGAERKGASKDDFSDIGTDAQQADGSAAGPSTS
jgi:hypothetical protein